MAFDNLPYAGYLAAELTLGYGFAPGVRNIGDLGDAAANLVVTYRRKHVEVEVNEDTADVTLRIYAEWDTTYEHGSDPVTFGHNIAPQLILASVAAATTTSVHDAHEARAASLASYSSHRKLYAAAV
ncbi:hypothetical protein [Streptosporangium sp. NPDC002524]|uniref:hypothetical protein n=1 Tax=Streptosporangium sp. NPDC002524 TaxID=3154537 RepID=UPI00332D8EBF